MSKPKISIVVPCYNEESALPVLKQELNKVRVSLENKYSFEVIYIDDGSVDNTLKVIKSFAANSPEVKYISFSRNFGKEAAIYAGLQASTGEYTVIMDADCQDPPALLPDMLKYIVAEGYDSVATRRVTRKGEPLIRSFFARCFYKLMSRLSKTEVVDGARDYRLMTRQFVEAVLSLQEYNRFSKGLFGWVGFKTKWIEFENVKRAAGETKWSFWKLFLYSIDGIVAFSTVPLAVSALFGIICCIIAVLFIIVIILRTLIWGDPVSGWPSLVCIILLLGGIQLLCIGILGQYISKAYLEEKKRPIYICKESNVDFLGKL